MWFAFAAFGGEIHLCGLIGDGVPVEIRGEPLAGSERSVLSGVRIVEHGAHRLREPGDVARRERLARLPVDYRLAEAADVGGDQRDAGGCGLERDDAERFV